MHRLKKRWAMKKRWMMRKFRHHHHRHHHRHHHHRHHHRRHHHRHRKHTVWSKPWKFVRKTRKWLTNKQLQLHAKWLKMKQLRAKKTGGLAGGKCNPPGYVSIVPTDGGDKGNCQEIKYPDGKNSRFWFEIHGSMRNGPTPHATSPSSARWPALRK